MTFSYTIAACKDEMSYFNEHKEFLANVEVNFSLRILHFYCNVLQDI